MIVRGILGNTVGRVGSFAKRRLLGKLPENAIQGSFQEEKPKEDAALLAAQFAVEDEIMEADELIKMAVEDSFKAELEAMNYDGVESALSDALQAEAEVSDAKKEVTL